MGRGRPRAVQGGATAQVYLGARHRDLLSRYGAARGLDRASDALRDLLEQLDSAIAAVDPDAVARVHLRMWAPPVPRKVPKSQAPTETQPGPGVAT